MENNDRYLLQKYNEREYGIFDTEKDKFIQKGSLRDMQGAIKDLNNSDKKPDEDVINGSTKEPVDNEFKEEESKSMKTESYYYDIHVVEDEDNGMGYSVFLKTDKHHDEEADQPTILLAAVDAGILPEDEVEYVDNVTEINEDEYNKATNSKKESYNGFGNKLTESKTDVAAEAIQKYIKEDGSFDTEWFNESVQLQITNVEYLYNKMYNSQSPAHSVAYSGMLQLFATDGYELTSRQVQAGFKKLGLDFKEILKPTTDWVTEKRKEEKEESKEIKTEDMVVNPKIKDLANEVFDWYDSDMGNHFDEIKDNEKEVYNHILSSLENKDKETIDVYIKDMSEDDTMTVVVNQLKQLKDGKLDEELFSASDEVKEDSKEKGLYTESEEPYEASKYKGKEWGIFAKKSRAWVAFGTEKEMKERAERLNKLPKQESKEIKTESIESDNIERIKDCMKQSGIKNPNTLERMSKDVLSILHTYNEDTRDENGLYYFPAILNAIQDKIEQITGKRPELTIESKEVKTESIDSEEIIADFTFEKLNYYEMKSEEDNISFDLETIIEHIADEYSDKNKEDYDVIYREVKHWVTQEIGNYNIKLKESKEIKTENNIPEYILETARNLFNEINKLDDMHSKTTDIEQGKKYVDKMQELTNRLDQLETQYHFGFLDNGEIKLNEAEEIDSESDEEKTILDYLQDRIGQKIEVSELNTVLQSLFARYDRLFITYDDVINSLDWDEPQELYVTDDDDTYTIIYNIVDIEEGIIEITDVIME